MGRSIFYYRDKKRKNRVKKFKPTEPKEATPLIGVGADVDAKLWSLVQSTIEKEKAKGKKITQRMIFEDGLKLYLSNHKVKYE